MGEAEQPGRGTEAAVRRRRNHVIWIGLVVTLVGAISYFTFFARFPALRDFPWLNLPLVLLGLALSAWGVLRAFSRRSPYRGRVLGAVGFALSLALAGLFCLYIFSLSYWLPEATLTSLELEVAPEFALSDQNGRVVRLADLRGSKVVLTFYRGHW